MEIQLLQHHLQKDYSSSVELYLFLYQKLDGHICVGLFLDFSINLCIYSPVPFSVDCCSCGKS